MATKMDEQVQKLVEIVNKKKAEISKAEKPNWLTNCSFSYSKDGTNRINIQAISDINEIVSALAFLIEKQNSFKEATESLQVDAIFKWLGFSFEDWKTDFQTRVNKIEITRKKKELEILETRLNSLISPELKAELELQELQALLGDSNIRI